MANKEYYTILAGRKEPAMVLQGQLSKTTGMPTGTVQKVKVVVGAHLIPNWSRAWGRRVAEPTDPKKKVDNERSVSVTDPDYRGKIEFLPSGHANGEAIEIRYLPNSNTLDALYQTTVQKMMPRPDGSDSMIQLQQGLNNFDEEKQRMLVSMLKHHYLNLNSPCRSEEATDYDFVNFDSKSRNITRMQAVNIRAEADIFVQQANDDKAVLQILAAIFRQDTQQQPGILLEYLIDKATDFPKEFVVAINEFKKQAETALVESLDAGILEIRDNGKLVLKGEGNAVPEILMQEVEGEGNDRKLWLIQNVVKLPEVYEAMTKIIKALDRYYKQLV